MTYYLDALKQYFNFKGRCGRKAFWMFVLFNVIFFWLAIMLDNIFGTTGKEYYIFSDIKYGAFYNFYSVFIAIPSLAIIVRRLHDVGKDWSALFILLIPIVGQIWMLLIMLSPGDVKGNEFGPEADDGYTGVNPYKYPASKDPEGSPNIEFEKKKITKKIKESKTKELKLKKEKKHRRRFIDRVAVDFTYHQREKRK